MANKNIISISTCGFTFGKNGLMPGETTITYDDGTTEFRPTNSTTTTDNKGNVKMTSFGFDGNFDITETTNKKDDVKITGSNTATIKTNCDSDEFNGKEHAIEFKPNIKVEAISGLTNSNVKIGSINVSGVAINGKRY